ncbi:MAG: hypothetical protein RL885_05985 [Planctomycetota bacterium]
MFETSWLRAIAIASLLTTSAAFASDDLIQRDKKTSRRVYAETLHRLASVQFSPRFEKVTARELATYLATVSELSFVVHPSIFEETPEEELTFTLRAERLSALQCLKLFLHQWNLRAVHRHGVILIVPKSEADKNVVLRFYSIQDMLIPIRDFKAPDLNLKPSKRGFDIEPEPEETATRVLAGDDIVDLIQENTGGESWDENEKASIRLYNGLLVVRQTEAVHREIRRLLAGLRGAR